MTAQRTLDVSHLPPSEVSSDTPLWWGQISLAVVEGTMFCILVAMYFYYRLRMDIWPPPGIQLPDRLLPAICLILLILSCIGSYLASQAAKRNDRGGMIFGMLLNLVFGCGAMAVRAVEWHSWNFKWSTTAYGSVTWAMLFLHTLDAAADLFFTLVLIIVMARGLNGPKQRLGVHVDSILWYFIVAIWIPMYVAVYWGPYIVGAP